MRGQVLQSNLKELLINFCREKGAQLEHLVF